MNVLMFEEHLLLTKVRICLSIKKTHNNSFYAWNSGFIGADAGPALYVLIALALGDEMTVPTGKAAGATGTDALTGAIGAETVGGAVSRVIV